MFSSGSHRRYRLGGAPTTVLGRGHGREAAHERCGEDDDGGRGRNEREEGGGVLTWQTRGTHVARDARGSRDACDEGEHHAAAVSRARRADVQPVVRAAAGTDGKDQVADDAHGKDPGQTLPKRRGPSG